MEYERTSAHRIEFACGSGLSAALTWYPPNRRQPLHRHEFTQMSFLLSGDMQEDLEGRQFSLAGSGVGIKPSGAAHADRWGPDGALIFTLEITDAEFGGQASPGWSTLADRSTLARLVSALTSAVEAGRGEIAADIAALGVRAAPVLSDADSQQPPRWLRRARERIVEGFGELRIAEAAKEAGVSRTHFARVFREAFGVPPSMLARRAASARALRAVVHTDHPLAAVAARCGFADQAHMTRTLGTETGLAPGRLRSMFA